MAENLKQRPPRDTILARDGKYYFVLPKGLMQALDQACYDEERSRAATVRWLIRHYVTGRIRVLPPNWQAAQGLEAVALVQEMAWLLAQVMQAAQTQPEVQDRWRAVQERVNMLRICEQRDVPEGGLPRTNP